MTSGVNTIDGANRHTSRLLHVGGAGSGGFIGCGWDGDGDRWDDNDDRDDDARNPSISTRYYVSTRGRLCITADADSFTRVHPVLARLGMRRCGWLVWWLAGWWLVVRFGRSLDSGTFVACGGGDDSEEGSDGYS